MLKHVLFSTFFLMSLTSSLASECPVPSLTTQSTEEVSTDFDKISILAKEVDGNRNKFSLKTDVELQYQGQIIKTDIAEYDADKGIFTTPNEVSLTSSQGEITGLTADFDLIARTANFKNAEFIFSDGTRGSAEELDLTQEGQQSLKNVVFSSCPKNHTGWQLIAPKIVLDQEQQRGYAQNMRLEFADVPILYLPYFTFPLNNQRKSGLLIPNISTSDKSGLEISLPYYWNISGNMDLTATPQYLSDRGVQFQNEFRHLSTFSTSSLNYDILFNDSKTDDTRTYFNLNNRLEFGQEWDIDVDINDVSDEDYFIDFGGSLTNTAITNLNREIAIKYFGKRWSTQALIQDYQVLSPSITNFQEPYRRLPQVSSQASWSNLGVSGLKLNLETELVNFKRNAGIEGMRANIYPQLEHSWSNNALSVTSTTGLNLTQYSLDNVTENGDSSPTRSLPIFNVDARLFLERDIAGGLLPQTLEPRIQYTYIPFRDQSDLPIFDTALPDLTQNQLFSPWRFSGLDRIGDTHQVALGLSSRLLGNENGQSLRFDLGQIYYLNDRKVSLSGTQIDEQASSLLVGEGFWRINNKWSLQSGLSWDSEDNQYAKRNFAFSYSPNERTLLNMGYRSVRGSLDQTDVAIKYPINERINLVGRLNYDRLNSVTLDRYWGLEYDTCCWSIRTISRRYISDREGNSDNAFLIQLELKGLSSVGARADRLLQENIFNLDQ